MRKLFVRIFQVVTVLAVVPLLLAYLAPHVSPVKVWWLAYFGLLYPVWVVLNGLMALVWLFLKSKYILIPAIAMLIGWGHLWHVVSLNMGAQPENTEGIRLITYNVKNFDFYNWDDNQRLRQEIFHFLEDRQPDVLALQEHFTQRNSEHDNQSVLQERLGLRHLHVHQSTRVKNQEYGQALYSRFPMVERGTIPFPNSRNGCIWADLDVKGDTIRVFNVHLQSIFLGKEDEEAVGRAIREQEADPESSRRVLGKLKRGFLARAAQADSVRTVIDQSPHPVMVCGDLNDTPVSYAYKRLQRGLQDAFSKKGSIIGSTFAGSIPWLRIDYVLVDQSLEVDSYVRHLVHYSDHFPVEVWVDW